MLSDKEMYARMREGWKAGRPHTVCGNGTLPKNSERSRAWLPVVLDKYRVLSLADAGAGDLVYAQGVQWPTGLIYRPYDLIPRHPDVTEIDITTEDLEPADAILCRMVLNHLDRERIGMALERFRRAANYLIATQFDGDQPKRSAQYTRLDLRPYLGDPLESVQDGAEAACRLAIWRL
jgi:hypothetical protein